MHRMGGSWIVIAALWLAIATPALAEDCPFLSRDDVKQAIGEPVKSVNVTRADASSSALANEKGVKSATQCTFAASDDPAYGGFGVLVRVYENAVLAKAAFDRARADAGTGAHSEKFGDGAFWSIAPGIAGSTTALHGARVVIVTHRYSAKVRQMIDEDPDGGVISTSEIARNVLGKL